MAHKNSNIPKKYIEKLYLNGLNGRLLTLPGPKKGRDILLVYGHHSSLERIYGIAEVLADYGTVTVPDLPGFGGMDSLHKVGLNADFDTLADYLASFIKTKYKNKKFTLASFSIGFAITTRMLQKYPEIAKDVELLISVAGFSKKDDFKLSKEIQLFYKTLSKFFSFKPTAVFFRYVALNSWILRFFYRHTPNARHKFNGVNSDIFNKYINFEIELWHNNDVQTYMQTTYAMFTSDLTQEKINLAVHHVSIGDSDQYFNNKNVEKHLKQIYKSCSVEHANLDSHMPSVIATKEEAASLLPKTTRKVLGRKT